MGHKLNRGTGSSLLALLILALIAVNALSPHVAVPARAQASNPIVIENQFPGFDEWQLAAGPGRTTSLESPQHVLGYANTNSINKGEQITFYVTVTPTQQFTMTIYRMGYYQGQGGRVISTIGPVNAITQPTCPQSAVTGMTECAWTPTYTLTVPSTWTTGIYIARLTNAQLRESHITFVVRDDARKGDILYQLPVLTYAAYNNYPNDGVSGKRLYDTESYGLPTSYGTQRAVKVSFNRPYRISGTVGSTMHTSNFVWEQQLIAWMEQQGYDIVYTTDIDTHERPERLKDFKMVVAGGHSEYWTREMIAAWESARDAGISLAFMGGNVMYWQVRLEADATGKPNRTVVCFKDAVLDPITNPLLETHKFRDSPVSEQPVVGQMFQGLNTAGTAAGATNWVATNTNHWAYAGTGMQDGDKIPRVVGHEIDAVFAQYAKPISTSFTLLASSPFTSSVAPVSTTHNSTLYQAPSSAWVWSTGSLAWSWGLFRQGYVDTRVQKITDNIFRRMIAQPASATATAIAGTATSASATAVAGQTATAAVATATAAALPTQTLTPSPPTVTPLPGVATATPLPPTSTFAIATPTSTVSVQPPASFGIFVPIVRR